LLKFFRTGEISLKSLERVELETLDGQNLANKFDKFYQESKKKQICFSNNVNTFKVS